jgi:hypothetical protein
VHGESELRLTVETSPWGARPLCNGTSVNAHAGPGHIGGTSPGAACAVSDDPAVSAHDESQAIPKRVSAHSLIAKVATR